MSRRKLTEQEKAEQSKAILQAMECGNIKQAFTSLGLSRSAFYYKIKALNLHDDIKKMLSDIQENQTQEIERLVEQGISYKTIANRLNISYRLVLLLAKERKIVRRRPKNNRTSIDILRAKMMSELATHYTYSEIADVFKCSRQNVHQIVTKEKLCEQ